MNRVTLSQLVTMVRAEAGHSLSISQGLNTLEPLKHIIRRTQYELWTAFNWPTLVGRWDVAVQSGQVEYAYPTDVSFDQIREALFMSESSDRWLPVEYGIPEDAILPNGNLASIEKGPNTLLWDTYYDTTAKEERIRIWPKPSADGTLRLKGQRKLDPLVDDDDVCTLDGVLISLFASAEMLTRAKADDAGNKTQKAQRHLQKLLANTNSDKQKVSTFGAIRSYSNQRSRLRPGLDYIP